MTLMMIGVGFLALGTFVGWRLATCPVLRTLRVGLGSYHATCEEQISKPQQHPTYHPHDPLGPNHPTVQAARRVA